MNKSLLRKKIFKIKKKKFHKDLNINPNTFIEFLKFNKFNIKNIGGYYPSNYEIDDLSILELLGRKNYRIALPSIKKNYQMDFCKWSIQDPLKINKFGIPEPLISKIIYPDLLLVPLVAFDNRLNRLGYGGGFYDRYIEKIEIKKKVFKVGFAFSFQELKEVPVNNYDKKLDLIITERGLIF